MDKAPDAYRTISEVGEDLDIAQHVLRFWETRFPQIKPLKRGGGRRYYRPDDVELLKGIRHLLYREGYTIKGVQRILKEQGARAVQAIGRAGQMAGDLPPASLDDWQEVPLLQATVVEMPRSPSSPEPASPSAVMPVPPPLPLEQSKATAERQLPWLETKPELTSLPPSKPVPVAQSGLVAYARGALQPGRSVVVEPSPIIEKSAPAAPPLSGRRQSLDVLGELEAMRSDIQRVLASREKPAR